MSWPASRCAERGEEVSEQDLARRVVAHQPVQTDREVARTALGTPRIYVALNGGLDRSWPRICSSRSANTRSRSSALPGAAHLGKRPRRQVGELLRFADVLLPCSGPLDDPQSQRVVMIRHGGQHRTDVVDLHIRAKLQDQRNAPATGIAQPVLEEARDVRRDWGMHHVIGDWRARPPAHRSGRERLPRARPRVWFS